MRKLISVVIPVYNEEDCLVELGRRLREVFDREKKYDFECLLIENGSTDRSEELIRQQVAADSRFKMIQLARNFRMDGGVTAGLDYVTGDACVLMTADLQDPPEVIPSFLREWEKGIENVYGLVEKRIGVPLLRRVNSVVFYWLASRLTGGVVVQGASDFRLVDRKVYEVVRGMRERNRFVRALFSWVGFSSVAVPIDRPPRFGGESKADFLKVLDLALKGIFAHSYAPLKIISGIGIALGAAGLVGLIVHILNVLRLGVPFDGFGSLVGLMLLGFGIVTTLLGVLGEYLALIYEEVKARPNFVVRQTLGLDD